MHIINYADQREDGLHIRDSSTLYHIPPLPHEKNYHIIFFNEFRIYENTQK